MDENPTLKKPLVLILSAFLPGQKGKKEGGSATLVATLYYAPLPITTNNSSEYKQRSKITSLSANAQAYTQIHGNIYVTEFYYV